MSDDNTYDGAPAQSSTSSSSQEQTSDNPPNSSPQASTESQELTNNEDKVTSQRDKLFKENLPYYLAVLIIAKWYWNRQEQVRFTLTYLSERIEQKPYLHNCLLSVPQCFLPNPFKIQPVDSSQERRIRRSVDEYLREAQYEYKVSTVRRAFYVSPTNISEAVRWDLQDDIKDTRRRLENASRYDLDDIYDDYLNNHEQNPRPRFRYRPGITLPEQIVRFNRSTMQ